MTQGFMNEWQPGDTKDIDGKQYDLESWQRTHAQLLKSVADAQAKLLAAQNETNDRAESLSRNLGLVEKRLTDRLEVLGQRLTALTVSAAALNGNHSGFKGQLDAIGAILAELLTVRRPVARPAKRRKRRG